jgi:hypothetical protein
MVQKRSLWEAPNAVSKVRTKVNRLWPNPLLVIALHSPDALLETGEAIFRSTIDVARRAGARVLALRASASLAKLCRRLERINDARRTLASAQSEFSEGLSSEDMNLAEFLLEVPEAIPLVE